MNPDFDVEALFAALDSQRQNRGLSWAAATREINAGFKDVPARPIATSTLTGMRSRSALEGNCILQVLLWLGRTPEDFVPGREGAGEPLTESGTDLILRWDTAKMHAALDAARTERGLTWPQVADEIEGYSANSLRRLATPGLVDFPRVMRIFTWLGEPSARFARPSRT